MKIQPDHQTLLLAGSPAQRAHAPGSVFAVLSSNRLGLSAGTSVDDAELMPTTDAASAFTYTNVALTAPSADTSNQDGAAEAPNAPPASRSALGLYASTQAPFAHSPKALRIDIYA